MLKLRSTALTRGFTIVELLIVIVVIAILASITIVTFNGIQKRAQTAQYAAAADGALKAIKAYKIVHENDTGFLSGAGVDPSTYWYSFCLARVVDLPARDGFAAGQCVVDEDPDGNVMANDVLLDRLYAQGDVTYRATTLPVVTTPIGKYRGLVAYAGVGGVSDILWMSPDDSSCGTGFTNLKDQVAFLEGIVERGTTEGTVYEGTTTTIDEVRSILDELKQGRELFGGVDMCMAGELGDLYKTTFTH